MTGKRLIINIIPSDITVTVDRQSWKASFDALFQLAAISNVIRKSVKQCYKQTHGKKHKIPSLIFIDTLNNHKM